MFNRQRNARPPRERRAFSLLELATVVAIIGLIAGMAVSRWGDYALRSVAAQGLVRNITLSLNLARRQAIAEGLPAAVVFQRSGGAVTSIQLYRVTGGGDTPCDAVVEVPTGVTVTTTTDRWQYGYDGVLTAPVAGGFIGIADGDWNWDLTVNALTGHIEVIKAK